MISVFNLNRPQVCNASHVCPPRGFMSALLLKLPGKRGDLICPAVNPLSPFAVEAVSSLY
jgi:hypothetical protein